MNERSEFLNTQLSGIFNDFWQRSAPNFEESKSIPRSELKIFSEGVLGPPDKFPSSYLGKYQTIKDAVVGEAFEKLQTAMETALEIQDDQFLVLVESSVKQANEMQAESSKIYASVSGMIFSENWQLELSIYAAYFSFLVMPVLVVASLGVFLYVTLQQKGRLFAHIGWLSAGFFGCLITTANLLAY